jgi:adenosine deaminase
MNLGQEYAAVARAFGYSWENMVQIALDGVQASWLPESNKAALRLQIVDAATNLRPEDNSNH